MIKCFFAIIFFLLFTSSCLSQGVGIGLSSLYVRLRSGIGSTVSSTVDVINPSPYSIKARVYFDCTSCVKDVKLFGIKIGESIEDPYQLISLDKKEVDIPPFSMKKGAPITITLTPKLIIFKNLKIYTPEGVNFYVKLLNRNYPGYFLIPYPYLIIGTHNINGTLTAEVISSSFGYIGVRPAVGSTTEIYVEGMPLSSFILLVVAILLVLFVCIRRVKKKIKPKPSLKKRKLIRKKK